jgi:hypothetical protein
VAAGPANLAEAAHSQAAAVARAGHEVWDPPLTEFVRPGSHSGPPGAGLAASGESAGHFALAEAGRADHFQLDTLGGVLAGVPFDLVLTARDAYGNRDANYQGTVTFWTSDQDPGLALPAEYTFTADDGGSHTFAAGFTLVTPGDQVLRALDLANGLGGEGDVTLNRAGGGGGL